MVGSVVMTLKKQRWGYFFLIPAIIFFIGFVLVPFIKAIKMGFYDYTLTKNEFIGFSNYENLFRDEIFIKTILNTLKYVVVIVPTDIFITLVISLVVYNQSDKLISFVRASFYLPAIIPSVCMAVVWKWLYNPTFGMINSILSTLGFENIDFLGDIRYAIYSLMLVIITWSVGQPIIIYIAALRGIPSSLHEAADIDGAGLLKKFFCITLPLLKPATLYNVIILTISVMQVVESIILMTSGGPYYSTGSILYLIYNYAFKLAKFGYASAAGNIMFIMIFILSIIQYKYLSTDVEY